MQLNVTLRELTLRAVRALDESGARCLAETLRKNRVLRHAAGRKGPDWWNNAEFTSPRWECMGETDTAWGCSRCGWQVGEDPPIFTQK